MKFVVSGYAIKDDIVNCRSGPGTSNNIVRTYKKGTQVTLSCQTPGTTIGGNNLWDKTQHGSSSPSGGGSSSGYCKGVSAASLNMIKVFEGYEPNVPPVGYGHLCQTTGCKEVKYKFPLTKETAEALLKDDIPNYTCLGNYLNGNVKLNENQWGALVSWVFNMGCGAAQSSPLVKRLNAGENPNTVIASELPKWNMAGGRFLLGLDLRRKEEVKFAQTPSNKQAFPNCE
ncbi:lysozyme-like protein [Linderina pennispora]|uniref:Lysozyme-like protein n=1 Tax=Linderina pennispora TaxID=61395 RepID=A0A1Y1WCE2_9FUNG|nr:lysozyme-like protein [Linderina pennispora]ORX70896.1 lysozyme-like protein [Linderina pennispora]